MKNNGLYDFIEVVKSKGKNNRDTYTPTFVVNSKTKDLMVRGNKFRAIYNWKTNLWETNINVAMELIDEQVYEYVRKIVGDPIMDNPDYAPNVLQITRTANGLSKKFRNFCEVDMDEIFNPLNQNVKFSNSEIKKEDYVSYKMDYPLQPGSIDNFKTILDTLYLPDEQKKICWMIGAMLAGDQGKIQKFFVFFGAPGTGKSTILNIIETLLGGKKSPYIAKFTAELLVNKDSFGTDFLFSDPIFAFDDEAVLSRVDSKSTLNLIASHDRIRVNGKYAHPYFTQPNCFLVCGTNEPVQISPRSGFIRRLIDIRPTGELLPVDVYDECMRQIEFEKSGIANYCYELYKKLGKNYYNRYIPEDMLSRTDTFHNFVKDHYLELKDGVTLANAYDLYCRYSEECKFGFTIPRHKFRDNLKVYFDSYGDYEDSSGKITKSWFSGFKEEKIGLKKPEPPETKQEVKRTSWLEFKDISSRFDKLYSEASAQYANEEETPSKKWENVKTKLKDLNTYKLHYVKLPESNHIVIDFDLKDENGNKDFNKNLEAASKFPPTYAELSKSGSGIHLHYIYTGGDVEGLSRVYGDNIEVKVFTGNSSLRRKLSKCNDLPINEISSGLPLKGENPKMIDWDGYKNEKILRSMIVKNLNKEYHPNTKPSIDYINDLLDKAYRSGISYDVRDLEQAVFAFALQSTHKSDYCVDVVSKMHFCSDDYNETNTVTDDNAPIVILDIESYPEDENGPAFLGVAWKYLGDDKSVVKMYNPSPKEVEELFRFRLVGHNIRGYDAHILYARSQGYTEAECNRLSQRIIAGDKNALFREAYHIPYADTLDFASAANKMGLKKWEYKLKKLYPKIKHQEMNLPWDKSAPKDKWVDIMNYCENDVIATEALWDYLQPDFIAREILADLSGLTVIDTTNQHTTAILTHGIKNPQQYYIYTDLSTIFPGYEFSEYGIDKSRYKEGAKIVSGKSIYKGIDPGEGGRKIGYPGMYTNVGLFDVASMHPSSMIHLKIFGKDITKRLENLKEARVAIKHGDYDKAIELLGDKVKKYLTGPEEDLKKMSKALSDALKTAINSVYGLTSASFDNKLRDPRNKDNIVAKYGALFMIDLEEELTNRGYKVVHVSTDSIKVANVDDKIAKFIVSYGKKFGFDFEYEALYSKMCLINDSVYIAKVAKEDGEDVEPFWTATGKQFAVPYVFKTLFSHEEIIFDDMCEVFNVKEGAIYLDHNEGLPDVSDLEKQLKKLKKDELAVASGQTKLLEDEIAKGHDYQFIGNVGQFTPIISGCGGAVLYRIKDGNPSAVQGTKGFRWLESENVKLLKLEDKIDRDYYRKLVDEAVAAISEFGDIEWLMSNE